MSKLYDLEKKHMTNGMFKMADDLIEQKEKNLNNNDVDATSTDGPQCFIDQLYKKRDEFDLDEIKDEINTIIIAVSLLITSDTCPNGIYLCTVGI